MATSYDAATQCWHGQYRPPILNPAANLGPVLLNVLERTPHKPAQLNADNGTILTCIELRRRSVRFAQFLNTAGFRQDEVVALIARNSDNVAPVAFGCFLAGVPLNTLDPAFSVAEVAHVLRLTRPKFVVGDLDAIAVVREAAGLVELSFDRPFGVLLSGDDPLPDDCFHVGELLECTGAQDDPARLKEDAFVPLYHGDSAKLTGTIVCSSGTTGLPKAVRLSHAQLIAGYQRISQLDRDETILCFSTLYWISGVQMLLTGVLNGIRRVITAKRGTPERTIDLCNRYGVTLLLVTPALASDIVRALAPTGQLPSVRLFAIGGSAVPVGLRTVINQRVLVSGKGRCFVGYGTSETGSISYELIPRGDSVGFLLPGVTAKIVDETGQSLGPGESGELLVRPVYPFLGYHSDSLATHAVLDEDGFVRTGDIAYFDDAGFLYLVDRKREILKYDNYQIAPAELESRIGELTGVRQVVVIGLTNSDRPYNDRATALIVRMDNDDGRPDLLTEQRVVEHCARTPDGQIRPVHKHLHGGVIFVEQLPMTVSGKVMRGAAKQLATEQVSLRNSKTTRTDMV
ncbi:probable 4-coumarate--CoA ligase 1 [Anopheles nili]|uniref:probable 4-coumarate--CoA ligase 1 n=1 Tax=Anopheles nili TaxID=185578 RepID=UPI00237AB6EB|nr:probable 4-coumarate--CoA ligase 1 [Anopheles nili]